MNLTCPTCYAQHSLDAMLELANSKDVAAAVARVPGGMGPLVLRYLSLFRTKGKAMNAEKAAKLIGELADAMNDATVRKHGRDWSAPLDDWRAAIELLLAPETRPPTLDLPLTSNKYLVGVMTRKANNAEAKAEHKREAERARGIRTAPSPSPSGGGARGEGDTTERTVDIPAAQPTTTTRAGLVNVRNMLPANIAARMGKPDAPDEPQHPMLEKPVRVLVGTHKGHTGTCVRIEGARVYVRTVQPNIGERVLTLMVNQVEVLE